MLTVILVYLVGYDLNFFVLVLATLSGVNFGGICVAHLFSFLCCPIMCLCVLSFVLWCPLRFPHKPVHLYLQLFVEGCMFYLRYLCLVAHSGVQHIMCCVFALFFNIIISSPCQRQCELLPSLGVRHLLSVVR